MSGLKKRGIYLIANLKSQDLCSNLIYSIRATGCTLPIRLIHFGGDKINSGYILNEVEYLTVDDFTKESQIFIENIQSVLTDCPKGFLYRFLAWFNDWDEFIYSDNDIVALTNWEQMFDLSNGYDLVHADHEYLTGGKYNFNKPLEITKLFGEEGLLTSITAGHFLCRKNPNMIRDFNNAVEWFKSNKDLPKKHDQAFINIAILLGNWKVLNLCKEPYNWLSSWAGDYKNTLELIHSIQKKDNIKISHIHYSGGKVSYITPIQELTLANLTVHERLNRLVAARWKDLVGFKSVMKKIKKQVKKVIAK